MIELARLKDLLTKKWVLTIAAALALIVWNSARPGRMRVPLIGASPGLPHSAVVRAEGRVVTYPGAEVVISSEISGRITTLPVAEKKPVKKGEVIAELAAEDLKAAVAEAKAKLAEMEAQVRFSTWEAERIRKANLTGAASEMELYQTTRDLQLAVARRESAQAALKRLEALLEKTRIAAPIDGVITSRSAHPGETVDRGTRLVTIANLTRRRIEAEVDEYDTAAIAPGAAVRVTAEGYETSWTGKVEEIPDVVTIRRLKPEDPARPTDTRVLLVKIALIDRAPLKLGQRVEVEIERQP